MIRLTGFILLLTLTFHSQAQTDTINTQNGKLNMAAFREGKSSYVVFFTDSAGNRISAAEIWDRSIQFTTPADGRRAYRFEWKVYRKDSLAAAVVSTGLLPSLQPLSHDADYPIAKRQTHVIFANNVVTVPDDKKKTAKDSAFRVEINPPGFTFPMDLELFPLLPFKKAGQKFAMAFYEPGSPSSNYYPLTVTGKEELALTGGQKVSCWLLRIDYAPGSHATFWIADKTREVLKIKEYFRGRYRYKVKLY